MHLTEADLERLTDGEITSMDGDIAHGHLIICAECSEALARRRAPAGREHHRIAIDYSLCLRN